jgi:uncharacterized protein involved in copper resistance
MKNKLLFCLALVATLAGCGGGKSSDASATTAPSAAASTDSMAGMNMSGSNMSGSNMSGSMKGKHRSSGSMSGMASAQSSVPPSLNCGAVQPVWVNLKTKVYHEPSDPFYGKTKSGEYLCPSQAKAQGFHAAKH